MRIRNLIYEICWLFLINGIRSKNAKLSIAIEMTFFLQRRYFVVKNLYKLFLEIAFFLLVMNILLDNQTSLVLEIGALFYQLYTYSALKIFNASTFFRLWRKGCHYFRPIKLNAYSTSLNKESRFIPAFFMRDKIKKATSQIAFQSLTLHQKTKINQLRPNSSIS